MNPFFEFHREALDPQIRENVRKTLPMLDEMKDAELREKVIDAWALSLQLNAGQPSRKCPAPVCRRLRQSVTSLCTSRSSCTTP